MSQEQITKNYFNCLDANSEDCDEFAFTAGPSAEFSALLVRNNAGTRDEGTSRSQTNDTLGYRYANTVAGTDNVIIDPTTGTATPGQNIIFEANGLTLATQQPNEAGESVTEVDTGGTERDGSNNSGQTQSLIDDQRVKQRTKIDGGNKAYPFITPLASTNIDGIEPIDPHGDIDNGESGTLYDPTLLEDEGIVYLRQYLSFDDEETGAVWRFQYAPQISWTRSATFQEDKSWGSNVQPAHYNNTSGKRVQVQGAILEGMTIGKTVTGAVKALEVLMSVANPDNELQVAPYAYRFIVGGRTLTEPVSGRHAPFVIEQLTVKEEMYDTQGEMILVKVDLTLREIPYYQINDGRKLLLITQDRADLIRLRCEELTAEINKHNTLIESRRVKNEEQLAAAIDAVSGDPPDKNGQAASILTAAGEPRRVLEANCNADSKAYTDLVELFQAYEVGDNGRKCNTGKDTSGFKTIERQFARNFGVYEIMKGRKLTFQYNPFLGHTFFDENGVKQKGYVDVLKELGVPKDDPQPIEPLNDVNNSTQTVFTGAGGTPKETANPEDTDYLRSCPHIYCVNKDVGNNTSDTNLKKAVAFMQYFAREGQEGFEKLQQYDFDTRDQSEAAYKSQISAIIGVPPARVNTQQRAGGGDGNDVILPTIWLVGDARGARPSLFGLGEIADNRFNDGTAMGFSDNGDLLKKASRFTYNYFQGRAADIENIGGSGLWDRTVQYASFLKDVALKANITDALASKELCLASSYIVEALRQKFKSFRKDREQNCSIGAAAAQESEAYEQYAQEINAAMELYVQTHLGELNRDLGTFFANIEAEAVTANGGRLCTSFPKGEGGLGLAKCLGAACLAQNILLIDKLLKPVNGLRNNPISKRNVYTGNIPDVS